MVAHDPGTKTIVGPAPASPWSILPCLSCSICIFWPWMIVNGYALMSGRWRPMSLSSKSLSAEISALRLKRRRKADAAPGGTLRHSWSTRFGAPKSLGSATGRPASLVQKVAFIATTPGRIDSVRGGCTRRERDTLLTAYICFTAGWFRACEMSPAVLRSDRKEFWIALFV